MYKILTVTSIMKNLTFLEKMLISFSNSVGEEAKDIKVKEPF